MTAGRAALTLAVATAILLGLAPPAAHAQGAARGEPLLRRWRPVIGIAGALAGGAGPGPRRRHHAARVGGRRHAGAVHLVHDREHAGRERRRRTDPHAAGQRPVGGGGSRRGGAAHADDGDFRRRRRGPEPRGHRDGVGLRRRARRALSAAARRRPAGPAVPDGRRRLPAPAPRRQRPGRDRTRVARWRRVALVAARRRWPGRGRSG